MPRRHGGGVFDLCESPVPLSFSAVSSVGFDASVRNCTEGGSADDAAVRKLRRANRMRRLPPCGYAIRQLPIYLSISVVIGFTQVALMVFRTGDTLSALQQVVAFYNLKQL